MSKQTEALKLALETLENAQANVGNWWPDEITTIREALAEQLAHESAYQRGYMDGIAKGLRMEQPAQQQEPVAWKDKTYGNLHHQDFGNSIPLYTSPPTSKPWVGLTNNELQPICDEYRILFGGWVEDFARAIEAKLREKNA